MGCAAVTQIAGARILVLGLGVTGESVVRALNSLPHEQQPNAVWTLDVKAPNATFASADEVDLEQVDLIIASPGWAPSSEILVSAAVRRIPTWSEIELAWHLRVPNAVTGKPAPWLGVTGTNGKTTTVQMLESILTADGQETAAVGNVGRPVVEAALDPALDILALELSSFQLHFTHSMSLVAGAVLNVAPDHIDWHGTYEDYARAKGKIFDRAQVACVYNTSDPLTRTLVEDADVCDGARAIGFTLGAPKRSELGMVEDVLCDRAFHLPHDHPERHSSAAELATLADLAHLAGPTGQVPPHVIANALAAAALARAAGVDAKSVRAGLRSFSPGGHRIALIASYGVLADGSLGAVSFVDDSKATNAHAAAASLDSFADSHVVWIAGGLAKGATFDELVASRRDKLRAAVIIGVDQQPMLKAFAQYAPEVPLTVVDPTEAESVMHRAVQAAYRYAQADDVVLMAPACASMDQFSSYADRGDSFAAAVGLVVGTAKVE